MNMKHVPFPFQHSCYVSIWHGRKQLTPIEAEEATEPLELYQALNYRKPASFTKPLVLHFSNPVTQTAVWFGFGFDVEVIVVGTDGMVKKTYPMPKYKEGSGIFIQFFTDYAFALLVPAGFCKKWGVKENLTQISRYSLSKINTKKQIS